MITDKELKNILRSVIYLLIATALLAIRIPLLKYRYVCQGLVAAAIVFYWLFLRSLKHFMPKAVKDKFKNFIASMARSVATAASKIRKRIRKLLGLPETKRKKFGKDERSFRFDVEDEEKNKKIRYAQSVTKWKKLTDNAQRIRYIYIKYIIQSIRLGLKFDRSMTHTEISASLKEKESSKRLFELYGHARYSDDPSAITDQDVESSIKLIKKKL